MKQHYKNNLLPSRWSRALFLVLPLLLTSCFSDEEGNKPVPIIAPIDISGTWGGNWSGYDPELGRHVSGNWEADLNQSGTTVVGSGVLDGDVDCMDGDVSGSMDKSYVISGDIVRDPCGTNEWVLTSLSLVNRQASGVWTKSSVGGEGDFSGLQVATPDGPRIRYFSPPGGLPGTVVSVTGERFADNTTDNVLDFNGTTSTTLQGVDQQHLVSEVPPGATMGPLTLTDTSGTVSESGRSVLSFNTVVTHPTPEQINFTIPVDDYGSKSIAITPNGRRAFVVFPYSIRMIDVVRSEELGFGAYTNYATQAIVASPDSRRIYVSTSQEVLVVDTGLNEIKDRITANGGNTSEHNPQGLAITPDGKRLLLADNRLGGGVSVIDIENKTVTNTLSFGTSATPYGIAVSPDGLFAYIALHELNQIKQYSLKTFSLTDTYDVGTNPTGLAILPDNSRLYVSNTDDGTVSTIDLASGLVSPPITVGSRPKGVAISPDGARIYTANYGSGSISIIDATTDTVVTTISSISDPIAVSIAPDGYRGYATSASSSVSLIGGPATLSIIKSGGGIGTVTSWPEGISCGESCIADYTIGTDVTLTASITDDSIFDGWTGDCYGTGNIITITMDSIKHCTANFYTPYVDDGTGDTGTGDYSGTDPHTHHHCFIATAAYGSYLDPHVEELRWFRDEFLLTNTTGTGIVEWYYANSPPVADYISQHESMRLLVRLLLTPLVYSIMYPVTALTILAGVIILLSMWLRNRKKHYTHRYTWNSYS
jgi:YVTN family beta-propeller protein